jgi:hypothetical protein
MDRALTARWVRQARSQRRNRTKIDEVGGEARRVRRDPRQSDHNLGSEVRKLIVAPVRSEPAIRARKPMRNRRAAGAERRQGLAIDADPHRSCITDAKHNLILTAELDGLAGFQESLDRPGTVGNRADPTLTARDERHCQAGRET